MYRACICTQEVSQDPTSLDYRTRSINNNPNELFSIYTQGSAFKPRQVVQGDISDMTRGSHREHDWRFTALASCKAQYVLHSLITSKCLVCWQVRERGERGAASSHYFSPGCLPGASRASESTGGLAYICLLTSAVAADRLTHRYFLSFFLVF